MSHILLVDDVAFIQRLVSSMITGLGHQCDIASSGTEALSMAQATRYDLIFMDLEMPDMHGLEVAQKLRQLGVRTSIVGFSGNSQEEDVQSCFSSGMCGFVKKPPTPQSLQEAIDHALANR